MKVVCIKDKWESVEGPVPIKDPKKEEICTVINEFDYEGIHYYVLKGYEAAYCSNGFAPIDDYLEQFTGALTKELENNQLIII
jgi:hypothetical protein